MEKQQFVINPEVIRNAAKNTSSIRTMYVELQTVDPRKLHYGDQYCVIQTTPVDDDDKSPDAPVIVGTKLIVVESIAGNIKPGFITVNGTHDLPMDKTMVTNVLECNFARVEDAKKVCEILANIEYDRANEILEKAAKVVNTLKEQIENQVY